VMERLMDLAARKLGLDPAELRRRNLVRPEEMPYRPGLTYKDGVAVSYDPGDFPAAFERALTLLDYDGWRRRQKTQATTPRRIGANAGPAVASAAREVRTKAARVAAELLECAPQDVRIEASRAFVAGMPDRALPLGRLAHAAVKSRALRGGPDPTLNACTYFYPDTVTWAFGTHAAAVEVDV